MSCGYTCTYSPTEQDASQPILRVFASVLYIANLPRSLHMFTTQLTCGASGVQTLIILSVIDLG